MSDRGPKKLPDSQLYALIVAVYLGWDLISLPTQAVKHLKHNGYLSVLLGALLLLPTFWVAADLVRRFPGRTVFQIFLQVLGKYAGAFCCGLMGLLLGFIEFLAIRRAHLMIMSYFFHAIPPYMLLLLFTAGVIYLARFGAAAVARLASFMLIPALIMIVGLLTLGLANVTLINVEPVLESRPAAWFLSAFDQMFPLLPSIVPFFFLQFFKSPQSVIRTTLWAMGTTTPIFFLHAFGTIGAFGPHVITKMAWPGVEYFHILDMPFFLLEQGGLLFIITWYSLQFIASVEAFYILGGQCRSVLGRYKLSTYVTLGGLLMLPFVFWLVDLPTLNRMIDRYVLLVALTAYGLLLLNWLVALGRGQRDVIGT